MDQRLYKDFSVRDCNLRIYEATGAELNYVARSRALANASEMAIGVAQLMRCLYIQKEDGTYARITEAQFDALPQKAISKAQKYSNELNGDDDQSEAINSLLAKNPPEVVRSWLEDQLPNEADQVPLAQGQDTTQ